MTERRRGPLPAPAYLLMALVLLACGAEPAQDAAASNVNCEMDPRVDVYTANLVKETDTGTRVTLISSDPAPPAKGNNTWRINIADATGTAVSNALIAVDPFMPDHGHGTSVTPITTPGTDGTYEIVPLNLFMPGVWRIAVGPVTESATDSAAFFLCING